MRLNLFDLINYFKTKANENGVKLVDSKSPIQSVLVSGIENARTLENKLQGKVLL